MSTHQTTPSPSRENRSSDHLLPLVPTWAQAISRRQGELKELDEKFETARRRTTEAETESYLADSRAQHNKIVFEIRERALADINKVLDHRREEQQKASKRLIDTKIEIESCKKALEIEQADSEQEKRVLDQEKKRLGTEAQANSEAQDRMERWARDLRDREARLLTDKGINQRAEAKNNTDAQDLSNAISALQQTLFDTDTAVNPTASAQESLTAIEPLARPIRQQYRNLLDAKIQAISALTALKEQFDKQRDELNSTTRELGAAKSDNTRLTSELIQQDHQVADLENFEEMARPIVAGEARLKEDERLWREEANRLAGKVDTLNEQFTTAQDKERFSNFVASNFR